MKKKALVLGCNGFIGFNMCHRLKSEGYDVTGVDTKHREPYMDTFYYDRCYIKDLRYAEEVAEVMSEGFDEVYQLAADMGGAGYIFSGLNDLKIMTNSVAINLNVINNAKYADKIFFSSSACVYPMDAVTHANENTRETYAYPANPDSEYGWEKLFSERMYLALNKHDKNINKVRIARFHNIFGEYGTFRGGKEKAPAAMIRKAIETPDGGTMQVWGDGAQIRSFLHIGDCLDAVRLLMNQDEFTGPVNIGSEEIISINDLAKMAIAISGKDIKIENIAGPTGVSSRNSHNALVREKLNWDPKVNLHAGMIATYYWIKDVIGRGL